MISLEDYRERMLSRIKTNPEQLLPVAQCYGLVLAHDVLSPMPVPHFDNSAMDGYAVRASDLDGVDAEHPRSIPVDGDIPAGASDVPSLQPGRALRILTGAPVPAGADAIVPVEDTDGRPREVLIRRQPRAGAHIRPAGDDMAVGDLVLPAGTRLGPAQLAAIAAAGVVEVTVISPVRVVVLSTGDELVASGAEVTRGHLVDSNGPMLAAAVRQAGHYAVHVGQIPDEAGEVRSALKHHLTYADAIITTGGISQGGQYDVVKEELSDEGTMTFTEVAMQPGKPQGFGILGRRRVPIFTLPGNPVSALVSFEVLVRPALARRAGNTHRPVLLSALVGQGWLSPEGKRQFLPVALSVDVSGDLRCDPTGPRGSHRIGSLARADALAIVPEEDTEVEAGDRVEVLVLAQQERLEAQLDAQAATLEEFRSTSNASGSARGRHRTGKE